MVEWGICAGKRLEISEVFHFAVLPRKELLACLNLLAKPVAATAVGGIERSVVAEHTTAAPLAPVAVGTRETGIDRQLLYPEGELVAYPCAIVVVEPLIHIF